MKHPVKTLATLAILGAMAPSVHAVSIKDDVLSITPTVRIQSRAQMSDATTGTVTAGTGIVNAPGAAVGDEYRVQGGIGGAVNDPIDFSVRRARLGLNFKYGSSWKGQIQINADNIDTNGSGTGGGANTGGTGGSRAVQLRYAWLERSFDLGDGMSHAVMFGLNKPFFMNPSDTISSSVRLMPNDNAASTFLAPRAVGLNYRFDHKMFNLAAALMNNVSGTKDTTTAASADEEEGFFYGVRAEFSFSPEWYIAKRAESFVGKEGQGLNVGLSYGTNQDQINAANATTITAYGVDLMFWLNGLSAYAEYRAGTTETEPFAGASTEVDAEFIVLQAAYAFPLEVGVLEPALRYQIIDTNTDVDQVVNFGNNAESGAAGTQIDVGLNLYLDGHANKLQLALSLWESEEGEGDATIIRLQHQINF